jgi:K(+)-stimulated pyrophosphate-energized sodium pump
MSTEYVFTPESLRSYHAWHRNVGVLLLLALLLLPWFFGIGPNSWRKCVSPMQTSTTAVAPAPPPATTMAETAAPAAATPPAAVDAAPSANVYFELDKTVVPSDTSQLLTKVIDYLKAHSASQAVLSGFHDPRGDRAHNEELALNRARAVRAVLVAAGIPEERVVMQKPQVTTGSGTNQEARRVEVTITP